MLYIYFGKDTYSRHMEVESAEKGLGDPDMLSVNTNTFKVSDKTTDLSFAQLKDMCETTPFLNPYRLIIVEGLLDSFETDGKRKTAVKAGKKETGSRFDQWKPLAEYVKQIPASTILLLLDEKATEKNPLFKLLLPGAKVRTFPPMKDFELTAWIKNRIAKNNGGSINPDAIRLLLDLSGKDLWALTNEVDKLLSFSGNRNITVEDVKQLTSYSKETSIFDLVDAIFERRTRDAQRLLSYMVREGATSPNIMSMITRQLRFIVVVKQMGSKVSLSDVSGIGIRTEFVLNKTLKQARQFSQEQIKDAYQKILQADINIKTGVYDDDLALEMLVLEICQN
jgi:DNA polymerase III subunit delta